MRASSRQRWGGPLLGLILLAGALHGATQTAYPPPHCDEAYYTDTALSAITRGRVATPNQGPVYGIDQNHTVIGRAYSFGLGGLLALAGAAWPTARLWSLFGWLAAVVLTSRAVSGHATLGEGAELESIAATVIGGTALGRGRGSIGNTVLGVLALGILTNGLNLVNVSSYYQMVLVGVIIAGAVYVDQWRHQQR